MNKKVFKQAIIVFCERTGIPYYQVCNYLTDGRLMDIIRIYEELNSIKDEK
jgi:hypothetical protein